MAYSADLFCNIQLVSTSLHHHIENVVLLLWDPFGFGIESQFNFLQKLLVNFLYWLLSELNDGLVQHGGDHLVVSSWHDD